MTNPLETYLSALAETRSTGAANPETSYYPALSALLNSVGHELKPKVRAVINPKNQGAGLPDGGFFTADQLQKQADHEPIDGVLPERGVIEVKPVADDVNAIAKTIQVKRYLEKYQLVLVTNYREFLLVEQDEHGNPRSLESFRLANDEPSFWTATTTPRASAKALGERFIDFLKRVMLTRAEITSPEDLAWIMASYAREGLARVQASPPEALQTFKESLEEALGIQFKEEKGVHFFQSTLVQTLFYGVFSAWVLWSRETPLEDTEATFDWKKAAWSLHLPPVRAIFEEVSKPTRLGALHLEEILNWTETALNRVNRRAFFTKFDDRHAVQYFYEPFLEAYDPQLRKELGVWYTPPEVVQYIVSRVDKALKTELGIADGLADSRVFVLDPCCGTGSFLVEVLAHIKNTLKAKGEDALLANDLKTAAMTRVFGFEIMPAPFVVSHLQLGLFLQTMGAPLSGTNNERVAVYLTNSLTDWEPPTGPQKRLSFHELQDEREAASKVKRDAPILVVLGNPPYNAFAGVSSTEEMGIVDVYKEGLISEWGIKKFNLDDLYIRFIRLAERRIAEQTGQGIVCYISNFSYLDGDSYTVMRKHLLSSFDKVFIDNLNGDSRETGKRTPDGKPDPSIFSTDYNKEGIRTGTAIGLFVKYGKTPKKTDSPVVLYCEFWGKEKRQNLVNSLSAPKPEESYSSLKPSKEGKYTLRPLSVSSQYQSWPKVTELSAVPPFNGPVERRGNALISINREPLLIRMKAYFSREVSDAQVAALHPSLMMTGNRIVGPSARKKLLAQTKFDESKIVPYYFKPLDKRYCYLDNIRPLFSEPSPQLLALRRPGNAFFITRDTADKTPEGPPFYFSSVICDYDSISGHARHFPLFIRPEGSLVSVDSKGKKQRQTRLSGAAEKEHAEIIANLSPKSRDYLTTLGFVDPEHVPEAATALWLHTLAIGFAPLYLKENKQGVENDWPRIPVPKSRELLLSSATLGKRIAELLDSTTDDSGKSHSVPSELAPIGIVTKNSQDPLVPSEDLKVTASWGHGKAVVMPGKGKLAERQYSKEEHEAIVKAATTVNVNASMALDSLGESTFDVYLNDSLYWKNIPKNVWNYYLGGHQVLKKWLSYRDFEVIGRPLSIDEAREATGIARRIATLILLGPALNENYRTVKKSAYPWL